MAVLILFCHAERSEASVGNCSNHEIFRFAQDGNPPFDDYTTPELKTLNSQ